jgi:hypothetical protein
LKARVETPSSDFWTSEITDLRERIQAARVSGLALALSLETGENPLMPWYDCIAYFFGGAFLANTLPHLINGISGSPFQSPFAKPPGQGLSSSTVNVLWGFFNLAVAYVLICRVGSFNLLSTGHVLIAGAGFLILSVLMAGRFGRFHGGNLK